MSGTPDHRFIWTERWEVSPSGQLTSLLSALAWYTRPGMGFLLTPYRSARSFERLVLRFAPNNTSFDSVKLDGGTLIYHHRLQRIGRDTLLFYHDYPVWAVIVPRRYLGKIQNKRTGENVMWEVDVKAATPRQVIEQLATEEGT